MVAAAALARAERRYGACREGRWRRRMPAAQHRSAPSPARRPAAAMVAWTIVCEVMRGRRLVAAAGEEGDWKGAAAVEIAAAAAVGRAGPAAALARARALLEPVYLRWLISFVAAWRC